MSDYTQTRPDGSLQCWTAFTQHWEGRNTNPVSTCLTWFPADPIAVRAEFFNPLNGDSVEWFISRDLLAAGMLTPTGCGDVRVLPPVGGMLRIVLDSPSGHADFSADADLIGDFLTRTYLACPGGEEFDALDVEAELMSLLEAS